MSGSNFSTATCTAPAVATSEQKMNKKRVREIAREEIRDQQSRDYFFSLMTGTDFDTRVRSAVDKAVGRTLDQDLSPAVNREVANYLREHLTDRVKSILMSNLSNMVTPLVKADITSHLNSLANVNELLQAYHQNVKSDLDTHTGLVRGKLNDHTLELQGIRDSQYRTFEAMIKQTATDVVSSLVGSNGAVLTGFKEELARQNQIYKNELLRENKADLDSNSQRVRDLESQLTNFKWLTGALFVMVGGVLVYLVGSAQ